MTKRLKNSTYDTSPLIREGGGEGERIESEGSGFVLLYNVPI
jgi:hypothetical protein